MLKYNLSPDTIHPVHWIKADLEAQDSLKFVWLYYVIMHFHTGTAQFILQTYTIQLNWNNDNKHRLK